jgi:signal transduction histidine kinase
MQIPDNTVGWGIGLVGAIVAWLVRLEARLNARPTRAEQEAIAANVAANVKDQFDEIKAMLRKQNESAEINRQSAELNRQLVADSLAEIRTKVAVLRDRAGDDPLADSGAHRRRL